MVCLLIRRAIYVPSRAFATHPGNQVEDSGGTRLHRLRLDRRRPQPETASINVVRANTIPANAQTSNTIPANTIPTNAIPARMEQADLPPDQPGDVFFISLPTTAWRLPAYNEVLQAAQNQFLCSSCDRQSTSGRNRWDNLTNVKLDVERASNC